ncbi:helix-turn-helix domain-containing protein [Streptomyces kanamyceticus]|uniref:nSTAND1 domain-containing NTPase n=1 Tax=Streptomyces kanamyceticus TaxID=1967 RepID=UPI0012FEF399|nr:helix-turn-helix domain-containing protein [Streptomyces kanamyceticus]
MGRREKALDPTEGPVQRLAHDLRQLRDEAGSPAYRELAHRTGYSAPTLSEAAAGRKFPSLPVTLAYVRACGGDEEEWAQRWQVAADAHAQQSAHGDDEAAPYRGLSRYGTGDQHLFFGRQPEVERLARMIAQHRFVALVGASGSGKSSLLRAGLAPELQRSARDFQLRGISICTPGPDPVHALRSLLALPGQDGKETILLVDQFEELFTLCQDPQERGEFIELLLTAQAEKSSLRVLIAVRADFYGHCADHQALANAMNKAHLLISAMSPDRLREAIIKPAHQAGLLVERSVTDQILEEVTSEPGGLPLMSHTLLEVWRRRTGRRLTLAAYEAIGGIRGAVAHTAESVFTGLTPEQAGAARAMLLRLVSPGEGSLDTRRPVPLAEIQVSEAQAAVLEQLILARLLTIDDDRVELAHEALISAWPRLNGWVDEERERLHLHRRLTEAARTWKILGEDSGALYRGVLLSVARTEFTTSKNEPTGTLNDLEAEFLTASIAEHDRVAVEVARTARRMQILMNLIMVLVASGLSIWVMWFFSREHP